MKTKMLRYIQLVIPLTLGTLFLLLFFQNCGPANLKVDANSIEESSTGSSNPSLGVTVNLTSLLQSPKETAANVLFPTEGNQDFSYALNSPLMENLVLAKNDFTKIEWVHGPSAKVIATGDTLYGISLTPDILGTVYIFGYRNAASYLISQFQIVERVSVAVNVSSPNSFDVQLLPILSDGTNETILILLVAPVVELSSIQFINMKDNSSIVGKRSFLLTKKMSEALDLQLNLTDVEGHLASKTFNIPVNVDSTPALDNCTFNGLAVVSGTTVSAYQSPVVAFGSSCEMQSRTCSDGVLSGSYLYSSCTVASVPAPVSCAFNGQTVASGSTVSAYQSSVVAYGGSCASQTRTCSNGVLSGSYLYSSCMVAPAPPPASCTFNGLAVASGSNVSAYQLPVVTAGSTCMSETRTCSNGVLSGSYLYSSCTVASVPAPVSCSFNGQTVASGNSITAYQATSVAYGSTCGFQTRTCTNGVLSGSYLYSACTVAPAPSRDAYTLIQAESMDGQLGGTTDINVTGLAGLVGGLDDGHYLKYTRVNFGTGALSITIHLALADGYHGQAIEIRQDSPSGPLLGNLVTKSTGGWRTVQPQSTNLTGATGIHDIYLVMKGDMAIANLDSFVFAKTSVATPPLSLNVSTTQVAPGGIFTVNVVGASALDAWVALYVASNPDSSWSFESNWMHLNGTKVLPGSIINSTTLRFQAPTTPGAYNIRFFANTGFGTRLAISQKITVLAP